MIDPFVAAIKGNDLKQKKYIYKGFVFITLYCDLLVDSLAVLRNNTERA